MGVIAGFGSARVRMVRQGTVHDHDPNADTPRLFRHVVNDPSYHETWVEGLDVYHNPTAKYPVDPRMLPGAAHHRLLPDGQIESVIPDWHPLASVTHVIVGEEKSSADDE